MLSRAFTFALDGLTSRLVVVEVDLRPGLPAFTIVGLGDRAVREARERVRAAIQNAGFEFPQRRVTVNLAPAYLRKEGAGYDLAIACGILAAAGQIPPGRLATHALFGELSLDGTVQPCRGSLAVAEGAAAAGLDALLLAPGRAGEAALVDGLASSGCATLYEAAEILRGATTAEAHATPVHDPDAEGPAPPDLADVRGQEHAIDALRIAAAGGHNLLLSGPPGTGKTMLARRLPSILPPMSRAEAIEVTRIASIAGRHDGSGLVGARPFRAPHHSISASGLVGGSSPPAPGEVTLAHRGVLFLDELSEFARDALEALRQPIEDGTVTIVRGQQALVFPTRCMVVASTNPCPCGFAPANRCRCSEADIARYRRKLSGPLLDRIDLLVAAIRPTGEELEGAGARTSAEIRAQVLAARARQTERLAGTPAACNAQMTPALVRRDVKLDTRARRLLRDAYDEGRLSPRGHQRMLRVARTVADLAGSEGVRAHHLLKAMGLRQDLVAPEIDNQAAAA